MSEALHKLIERKRKYYESCTNARTQIALRSEINILQETIAKIKGLEERVNQQDKIYWKERIKNDEFLLRLGFILKIYKVDPGPLLNSSAMHLKYIAEKLNEDEQVQQEINKIQEALKTWQKQKRQTEPTA